MNRYKNILVGTLVVTLAACASPSSSDGSQGVEGGVGNTSNPYAAYHDGTWDSPVALTLGASVSGKIGSNSQTANGLDQSPGYESFYRISGVTSSVVAVRLSGSNPAHLGGGSTDYYSAAIYNPANNGTLLASGGAYDTISPLLALTGTNANYNVVLTNGMAQNTTYTLKVETNPINLNEGSTSSPIPLNLGQAHTATTSFESVGGRYSSYYTFTLTQASTVQVSYVRGLLDASIYSNSDYSTDLVTWENDSSTSSLSPGSLAPGIYYLKMDADTATPARVEYTLTVTATP